MQKKYIPGINILGGAAYTVPEQLQMLKFVREGGKDIVLCNFGIHQTNSGGAQKFDISADIAGAMREEYEANDDCWFAYFTKTASEVKSR